MGVFKEGMLAKFKKYDFPIHVSVLFRRLEAKVSIAVSIWSLKLKCKFYGIQYGKNLQADGFLYIRCVRRNSIRIGENFIANSRFASNPVGGTNPCVLECLEQGSIQIGDNSGISFAIISSRVGITIGDYVKIGGNVRIFDHNYHSLDYMDRRGAKDKIKCKNAPIVIGDDVFIGTNSVVLKGSVIGNRSIIGAGSVVSGQIPPNEIWAGNPARFIRKLSECGYAADLTK